MTRTWWILLAFLVVEYHAMAQQPPGHKLIEIGTGNFRPGVPTRSLALFPKGDVVISSHDDRAMFWNTSNGEHIRSIAATCVDVAEWSGNEIVVCALGRQLRLAYWGEDAEMVVDCPAPVWRVSCHPTEQLVLALLGDGRLGCYDVVARKWLFWKEGRKLGFVACDEGEVFCMAQIDGITAVEWKTGRIVHRFATGEWVRKAAVFKDDLLAYENNGRIDVRTLTEGAIVTQLSGYNGRILDIVFLNLGKSIAACSDDGKIYVWEVASARARLAIEDADARCLCVFPSGQSVIGGGYGGIIQIWDAQSGRVLHDSERRHREIADVCVFRNKIVSSDFSGQVMVWDADSGSSICDIRVDRSVLQLVASSDAMVGLSRSPTSLIVWNQKSWDVETIISLDREIGVSVSNIDNQRCAIGCESGVVLIVDIEAGEIVSRHALHSDSVTSVCLFGSRGASGDISGNFAIWNATDGDTVAERQYGGSISSLARAASGLIGVAIAMDGRHVEVVDEHGVSKFMIRDKSTSATQVAYSSNGDFLAIGGYDGEVSLWSLKRSRFVSRLAGHRGTIRAIDFSGHNLITAGADDRIVVWRIDQQ